MDPEIPLDQFHLLGPAAVIRLEGRGPTGERGLVEAGFSHREQHAVFLLQPKGCSLFRDLKREVPQPVVVVSARVLDQVFLVLFFGRIKGARRAQLVASFVFQAPDFSTLATTASASCFWRSP